MSGALGLGDTAVVVRVGLGVGVPVFPAEGSVVSSSLGATEDSCDLLASGSGSDSAAAQPDSAKTTITKPNKVFIVNQA